MFKPTKRCWRPRFSLRVFLLFWLLASGGVAWLAHSYGQYLVEQRLIQIHAKRLPPGGYMAVATKGEREYLNGIPLM